MSRGNTSSGHHNSSLYMCIIVAANCQLNTGTPGGHASHYICADKGWGFVGTLCAGGVGIFMELKVLA